MAVYMIALRPSHVFENMGQLEQDLLDSAACLMNLFEKILFGIRSDRRCVFRTLPAELTKGFQPALSDYLRRFKAWKVPDEAKLTCRIQHALIALHQATHQLPSDEPEDSSLRVELRTQIARLRDKLRQIAGPDAVARFDTEHHDLLHPAVALAAPGAGPAGVLGDRVSNEQLAHELLLDPGFQLTDDGDCAENPVAHRIRASFHRAFWDSLADDLRLSPPCYVRVLRVLREIRDGVAEVAGGREAARIGEVVDLELIQQQADAGAWTWAGCVGLLGGVVDVVRRVQAQRRDAETRVGWEALRAELEGMEGGWAGGAGAGAVCRGLEFLLGRVSALRIDAANARLRLIAPVIREHGVDYERGKLQAKLDAGALTLDRTRAWLRAALARLAARRPDVMAGLSAGAAGAFAAAHGSAMADAVEDAGTGGAATEWAETLMLDARRFESLGAEYSYLVRAAVVLVTVRHALATTLGPAASRDAVAAVEAAVEVAAAGADLVEEAAAAAGRGGAGVVVEEAVRRAVQERLAAPSDAVHVLMRRRVRELWERAATGQEGQVASGAGAARLLGAEGLWRRAMEAAGRLGRLAVVNREVHRDHYNRIIAEEALALAMAGTGVGPGPGSEGSGASESATSGSRVVTVVSA